MSLIKIDLLVDAKGLACPMPIIRTKKAMNEIEKGQVIEVQATDKGSKADIQAWTKSSGHQYLGTLEDGGILKHYLRKSLNEEEIERKHPNVTSNEGLQKKIEDGEKIIILDVRESAEYAFNHIPNAISIPLGELNERMVELRKDSEIYIVCRTGNRSDLASQTLAEYGFTNIYNVVPGMSAWSGKTNSLHL
ncbi:sulfurtransferase TusA family protein [Bacillus sp. JJ664]